MMGANISSGDLLQQQMRGNNKYVVFAEDFAVGAGADLVTASEDVSKYTYKNISVTASAACTVWYQTSPDNTHWFDPLKFQVGDSTTPGDLTEAYTVNAESRSIEVTRYCQYIRVWVHATGASTVSVYLEASM